MMYSGKFVKVFGRMTCALVVIAMMMTMANVVEVQALNVWGLVSEAQKLEKKKDYTGAIAKYKQAAAEFAVQKEYGNATNMYRRIGDNYVLLKRYDDAVASWDLESSYANKAGQTQVSLAAKRKADMLRSTAQLFIETNAAAAGGANDHGAKYEPKNGALLGAYAELDPVVHNPANGSPFYTTGFPELTGKKHAAYLLYFTYGKPFSNLKHHVSQAVQNGTALQLGLQPMKGLSEVKDDAYLRGLAREIGEAGIPVFLRFANEMNGDWVPWHGDPKAYIEKFRLVTKVFKEEAPDNVVMVWSPDRLPEHNINDYYPGDAYVDWVGVSLYSIFNPAFDPLKQGEDRSSHVEKFDYIYKQYAARKPIFISEGGVAYMYPEKKQDKTDWAVYKTKEFYATLPMLYPKVKGVFWFDSNHDSSNRIKYYMLSANKKLLDAYKISIANPFYLGAIGEESPVAYKRISGAAVAAGKQKMSAYVKTWSPTLAKVTYEIGGRNVGTAVSLPWTVHVDFTPYRGKKIEVIVKAYNNQNKLVTTQRVPVTVTN
ncbi:glycoside hydrolase family 26 protein [Paenibacillus spongiae]|uniref:GH26 domain-containing protein n=1 Tax=Paenibacillus spongiae TaxID=2909671 RepID=A0ABY5SBT7_9BACL|nr:glycosyl hydrolase [Paenibacillus spongiae]UVI31124.1 hypothetical protein L1F29_04565 [Paenibacillus spongiae]